MRSHTFVAGCRRINGLQIMMERLVGNSSAWHVAYITAAYSAPDVTHLDSLTPLNRMLEPILPRSWSERYSPCQFG
jgi:hypothetical protein